MRAEVDISRHAGDPRGNHGLGPDKVAEARGTK